MVASNDTADTSGIYRPTADASGRPMPVYEGLSNGLESEISLLFGDAMAVRCEPLSYARRCIALVRSHDTADREAIREALVELVAAYDDLNRPRPPLQEGVWHTMKIPSDESIRMMGALAAARKVVA
jgi:hypothetical protein